MFIYKITNKSNGDFYIGKTIRTITKRFTQHKSLSLKQNSQTHLHRAMRKYGICNFNIEILEELNPAQNINEMEIYYISKLSPIYNMTSGGDGGNTALSPNFIKSMETYHNKKDKSTYATCGMKGKKQSKKFIESIKKSNSCPVMCEGNKFDSIGDAQEHYIGISIRKRLDNDKYPNFFRLKPKIIKIRK